MNGAGTGNVHYVEDLIIFKIEAVWIEGQSIWSPATTEIRTVPSSTCSATISRITVGWPTTWAMNVPGPPPEAPPPRIPDKPHCPRVLRSDGCHGRPVWPQHRSGRPHRPSERVDQRLTFRIGPDTTSGLRHTTHHQLDVLSPFSGFGGGSGLDFGGRFSLATLLIRGSDGDCVRAILSFGIAVSSDPVAGDSLLRTITPIDNEG